MALETCGMCAKLTDAGHVLDGGPNVGVDICLPPADSKTEQTPQHRIVLCHDCTDAHLRQQTH